MKACYNADFNDVAKLRHKNVIGEYILAPFEDIEVCVPKDYDKYLTLLYNDWRKWPPKEKQIGHHHDKGLSLTQGYKSYMKEHKI